MTEQVTEQTIAEIWQLFRETDTKFKETDARLDRRFQESLQQIRALEVLFSSQWGKLSKHWCSLACYAYSASGALPCIMSISG